MEPMTPTEILFMGLGAFAIAVVMLLGVGALMGGMNEEDEHGEGL